MKYIHISVAENGKCVCVCLWQGVVYLQVAPYHVFNAEPLPSFLCKIHKWIKVKLSTG